MCEGGGSVREAHAQWDCQKWKRKKGRGGTGRKYEVERI